MALIPPDWLDCVVALGDGGSTGTTVWNATGFFYMHVTERHDDGSGVSGSTFLVTNRHVVEGRTDLKIRVNPDATESASEFDAELVDANGVRTWLCHDDPEIDVAVLPVNFRVLQEAGMQAGLFLSDSHTASRAELSAAGLTEGDGVFIGTIARIRDALSGASNDFLVDCFIFPGNSGGPVVLKPELTAIQGTRAPSRALLVGIVRSYVSYQDVAISQQTKRPRVVFEENTGLASAHPIDLVEELARSHVSRTTVREDLSDEELGQSEEVRTSRPI